VRGAYGNPCIAVGTFQRPDQLLGLRQPRNQPVNVIDLREDAADRRSENNSLTAPVRMNQIKKAAIYRLSLWAGASCARNNSISNKRKTCQRSNTG
jgi:hypothetical protein